MQSKIIILIIWNAEVIPAVCFEDFPSKFGTNLKKLLVEEKSQTKICVESMTLCNPENFYINFLFIWNINEAHLFKIWNLSSYQPMIQKQSRRACTVVIAKENNNIL